MLQPLYYVLTIQCYSFYNTSLPSNVTAYILRRYNIMLQLYITPLQSNVTASTTRPYNLMLQSIYYVFTIQCYSLYITSLQSDVTAYILRPHILGLQPYTTLNNPRLQPVYYVSTI